MKTFQGIGNDQTVVIIPDVNYLEKIKQTAEEFKIVSLVPPGWIMLGDKFHPQLYRASEPISEYYSPMNAHLIMENRMLYREELNDILGDISPYWNIYEEEEEYDNDNDNEYSDESDDQEQYDEYF